MHEEWFGAKLIARDLSERLPFWGSWNIVRRNSFGSRLEKSETIGATFCKYSKQLVINSTLSHLQIFLFDSMLQLSAEVIQEAVDTLRGKASAHDSLHCSKYCKLCSMYVMDIAKLTFNSGFVPPIMTSAHERKFILEVLALCKCGCEIQTSRIFVMTACLVVRTEV